ncbi:alpha/beta hydrolase [Enterococcus sp. LJL51]|uniref:alpha/beta hydrolase n=1 Tax=Enterococcus sp. LJL51 TaxID=3416656 RepID=UPI003CEE839B
MQKEYIKIQHIPALLWGKQSDRLYVAVHGDQSNKEDKVIALLAEEAVKKGFQVLSFDLPAHGERIGAEPQNAQIYIEELEQVMVYAKKQAKDIYLFANSIGAYFSLLAFSDEKLKQTLFLSPILDMGQLFEKMMLWAGVNPDQLQKQQVIATPFKTLYWAYYTYVKAHPIVMWDIPTAVLYGTLDNLTDMSVIKDFSSRFPVDLTIMEDSEHFFHTEKQLAFYQAWLQQMIS